MFGFLRKARSHGVGKMPAAEARTLVEAGKAILIDVREEKEVATSGKARGARVIPLGQIAARADELPKDAPLVLYCVSGIRSQRAADALSALGLTQVYNMGGLSDWIAAGGPVER